MRRRHAATAGVAVVVLLSAAQLVAVVAYLVSGGGTSEDDPGASPFELAGPSPLERTVSAYAGQGAWVDVYDYAPAMQTGGAAPAIRPDDVDEMADHGVHTLYLQAANDHLRTPEPLVDDELVGRFVTRAHEREMRVVGWYLPRFADVDRDLAHLRAIGDFEVDEQRFDGVAVDIEWTRGVPDHRTRSDRLVDLSERLRSTVDGDALGAIVLPPVQMEVVNPRLWPDFPWDELAPLYDAWLPMGYWTTRGADSGHRDGYAYTEENVRRLRANLGDDEAVVHPIGGIGDAVTDEELDGFDRAVHETHAIGGSVYDWRTLDAQARDRLAADLGG